KRRRVASTVGHCLHIAAIVITERHDVAQSICDCLALPTFIVGVPYHASRRRGDFEQLIHCVVLPATNTRQWIVHCFHPILLVVAARPLPIQSISHTRVIAVFVVAICCRRVGRVG